MKPEIVSHAGWDRCLKLSNGIVELVATLEVGPRILHFGFCGGRNLMRQYPEMIGRTGGDEWLLYGGHRLWHAPEAEPRTYWPDNVPVAHDWDGATLSLHQPVEGTTGIQKQILITVDTGSARLKLVHRLTNTNLWDVNLAPWCLTVLAQGGRAILPQEEFRPHPEYLLPARPVVLWHYTDMSDPRWTWSEKYIQLRQDPAATTKQKIGILNKQGWAAYELGGDLLVKKFACRPSEPHADYGCNTEIFTNEDMLELETLGPLQTLAPGETAEHTEHWFLGKTDAGVDDASLESRLLPMVQAFEPLP